MSRLVLVTLFVLLLLIYIFLRKRKRQKKTPQERKKTFYLLIVSLSILFLIYLTLTGRMHFLVAMGAAIIPFLTRLLPLVRYIPFLRNLYQQSKTAKGAAPGKISTVETSLLNMTLNHDDGQMDGKVLLGPFAGKNLSDLALEDLLVLHQLAQKDHTDALGVLEAYLDRVVGESWRQQSNESSNEAPGSVTNGEMTRAEAYDILGLEEGASREEIIAAHRKLMQKIHPDRGGSNYLAAKLNQAKTLLLDR